MVIVHSIIGQLCLRGRAWVGSSSTPRISVHNGTVRVQKLALREGYASAGRAIPRRGPSPAVSQKYHPPVPSFTLFLSLSPLPRLRVTRAAASLDYLRVAARSARHPAPDNVLCSFFSDFVLSKWACFYQPLRRSCLLKLCAFYARIKDLSL